MEELKRLTEWRTHPIYTKYEISNTGFIRRKYIEEIAGNIVTRYKDVKQHVKNTCMKVTFSQEGIQTTYDVHRLVAELFIPNPNNHRYVRIIDGDQYNNNVNNLEWYSKSKKSELAIENKKKNKKTHSQLEFERLKEKLNVILAMSNEP